MNIDFSLVLFIAILVSGSIWALDKWFFAAKRNELAWIKYLNLFLVHQVRDGRLNELHVKHFGTPVSADMVKALIKNK